MATKSVTSTQTHHVLDGSISLSIIIGDAQMGTSAVRRNNESGEVLAVGAVTDLALGKGAALKGTSIYAKSVVTDINDMTNFTSITYVLNDGSQSTPLELSATVDNEGDSVVYRMTINFQ